VSEANLSPDAVLRQIDTIMVELLTLRRAVESLLAEAPTGSTQGDRPSAWDIIQAAPGHRQFASPEDVTRYLREERAAWDD
jgi:hypothetical protein